MQKGRFLLTLTILTCAALIFSTAVDSLAAGAQEANPIAAKRYAEGALTPSGRHYIGLERPEWMFDQMREIRTAQGSGPIPDLNLTPTATASEELYADSASYGELNRIVISSNGVDENNDGEFDPGVTADDFNLWLLRTDGDFATQLTDAQGDELYPAYSPGARLIAFSSNVSGTWQLYTVEVLTGTIRQLTFGAGNKYEPTWSPDSSWIVFSGDQAGNRDLYIIPSDGSEAPQPITQTPEDETQPTWAPVGGAGGAPILFTRSGGATGSRIFRIGSDGQNEEMVTNGGGSPTANDTDPAWRHNAQLIAFASDRPIDGADLTMDYNIWSVAPVGEDTVDATLRSNLNPADTYDDRYPAFNPGLNPRQPIRLFFTSSRPDGAGAEPDIWRLEVEDPVPPELVDLPSVDAPDRLVAPGGDVTIYVEVFDGDSGVAQVVAEFKDPDSAVDDSQGIDHKQFETISGSHMHPSGTPMDVAREVDCDTVGQTELFDDGDPAHGDDVAGDGIFSGVWTTPMSPSDFIIDMHVTDLAGNSFEYDDIYGFTTQMFEPSNNVLLVNDYCEGQGFIWAASVSDPSDPMGSPHNNDFPTQYPVESYYTTNPGGASVAPNTIRDLPGLGEPYDLWRVICRGPIEIDDLIYYLPTKETQLSVPDLQGTREVLIADRAIVWAAPHTGNVWTAAGSLVDATTQATLATFLDRGGRMMISGQDIGFALTLDGTQANNFYANYLHANYVRDDFVASREPHIPTEIIADGVDGDPVVSHPFPIGSPGLAYRAFAVGWWVHSQVLWPQDCAHYTTWPDVITATGDAIVTHQYSNGETAGLRYQAPAGGYRMAYYAWGFEQTHREYGPSNQPDYFEYRAKFMHNTLCWLRTGGFQGRVLSISDGNQPINDPTPIVTVSQGGNIVGAVRCQEDGRYVLAGLPPGSYDLRAHRPGYEIDHADAEETHGGLTYPIMDFAITRAEPGAIRGTVTSQATGEALATVQVCAYHVVYPDEGDGTDDGDGTDGDNGTTTAQDGEQQWERGELIGCTTTAADGTYQIGDVPPGEIVVVANGIDIGYGTEESLVNVTSGNTVTVDIALTAAPGEIIATVIDGDGNAVDDATVSVFDNGTLIAEAQTDANGEVTIEVQPGSYTVEASAPGYQSADPEPIDVQATQTSEVTITLQAEPPGSISGLIARSVSGEPVAGMTVEVVVNDAVIATTATTADTQTAADGSRYNYRFTDIPTGQVVVRPDPTGFTVTPTQQVVTIASGEETTGVNFTVSSIRRFPQGLQLISLPFDYPDADPAELLGANAADFNMAAWEPLTGQYALYPSTPADRFRLGTGYWLLLDEVRELTREGILAEDVYELPLRSGQSGWNLVGDFFRQPLDFFSLRVRDRNGVVRSMQNAMAEGLVRSPLFAYVLGGYATSSVVEPYVGYWLNVGEDITVIGNRTTDTLSVDEEASAPAVAKPEGGWLMPLVVQSGQMQDASTWIGCAPAATDGFDAGLDMLKPPPAGMASMVYAASEGQAGAQAVDVRAADGAVWSMSVQGPAGEKVTVRWPDMSSVPTDVRPILVDVTSGAEVYMRTAQSYEFTAREGRRELQIRLANGDGALAVTAPAARATAAGAEISYTLSADAEVEVRVLNIAGRVIDTVVDGDLQTAGTQRVTWDGLSARGTKAPNGTYLVVVSARAANGQQTQAIGTVALGR